MGRHAGGVSGASALARWGHNSMNLEAANLRTDLEERLRFEMLLADLSSKFVNLPADEVDGEIMAAQRRICEFLNLDLLVLWQLSDEATSFFSVTHFYSAQHGPQPAGQLHQEDYPWFRAQLLAGRVVGFSSLEELPAEAARDRKSFRQLDIKSNLSLPLSVGGGPMIGAFCLNAVRAEHDWPEALVKRLQLLAQIFANALARKRDEQALRDLAEKYKTITTTTTAGFWEVDCDGKILETNEESGRLYGYSRDELLSKSVQDIEANENPAETLAHVQRIRAAGYDRFETRHRCKDGRIIDVEVSTTYLPNSGTFLAFLRNITEQKHAEAERVKLLHDAGERIKELQCIYGLETAIRRHENIEELFREIVELLPSGWQFPEITCGRICFDWQEYVSKDFQKTEWRQISEIRVHGKRRGAVEIYYREPRPPAEEGPFSKEERNLIDGIAQVLGKAIELNLAHASLRRSEEVNRATFEQAAVGIAHVGIDGRWLRVNDRLCTIFGYPREELLQLTFQDITHPDDPATDLAYLRRVLSGEINTYSMERRCFRKDRSLVWINLTASLVRTPVGTPRHFISLVEDITDRKLAEEAQRTSEARLKAGAELAGLGCYEVNYVELTSFADERFSEICGVPAGHQDSVQRVEFWIEHIHPDDRQRVLEERQKLHEGKIEQYDVEYRYLHPAQGEKWIHHVGQVATRDVNGRWIRAFGVIRDITERKRREIETQELRDNVAHLARVNTLGALSGSLAHELSQPLGIILSNAEAAQELLAQEPPDVAEVQAILADIVASDRRAGEVIKRLRGLLKRGPVSLKTLSLNQVFEEVLSLTRTDLIERGITVDGELAADLPPIWGDRVQLQQLVINLLLNAADAMSANAPGARRVHLRTMLRQDWVRASVRDEGGGLPADVDGLFQPFYSTKSEGLGLGLAICRSIVDAHHGRLWAEPHAERGAVFHFELPVARGE